MDIEQDHLNPFLGKKTLKLFAWGKSCKSIGEGDFEPVCLNWRRSCEELWRTRWWTSQLGRLRYDENQFQLSPSTVKGTVLLNILLLEFTYMYLLGLEIVQGAFLAPCLGQEVPTKRNFGLKWLLVLKGTPKNHENSGFQLHLSK